MSRPQPANVRTPLEVYGVMGAERDGLILSTRQARQPGWWHSFRDVLRSRSPRPDKRVAVGHQVRCGERQPRAPIGCRCSQAEVGEGRLE
jgi:hypothetical protein